MKKLWLSCIFLVQAGIVYAIEDEADFFHGFIISANFFEDIPVAQLPQNESAVPTLSLDVPSTQQSTTSYTSYTPYGDTVHHQNFSNGSSLILATGPSYSRTVYIPNVSEITAVVQENYRRLDRQRRQQAEAVRAHYEQQITHQTKAVIAKIEQEFTIDMQDQYETIAQYVRSGKYGGNEQVTNLLHTTISRAVEKNTGSRGILPMYENQ